MAVILWGSYGAPEPRVRHASLSAAGWRTSGEASQTTMPKTLKRLGWWIVLRMLSSRSIACGCGPRSRVYYRYYTRSANTLTRQMRDATKAPPVPTVPSSSTGRARTVAGLR